MRRNLLKTPTHSNYLEFSKEFANAFVGIRAFTSFNVDYASFMEFILSTYFVCLHHCLNADAVDVVDVKDANVVLDDDNVIALAEAIEFPMNENVVAL